MEQQGAEFLRRRADFVRRGGAACRYGFRPTEEVS
jgi:hypothetical protein